MAAYGKILTIMFEMKFVVTRIRIKFKLIFSVCGLIPGVLLLSACGNGPWNNPYPESESAANIYYALSALTVVPTYQLRGYALMAW